MTDLESPKKNNDCYFYYYSTCAKGDSCTFRHEPSALGCETMCSFWKEGKCLNVHCNFRHMELRKNRKAIPCYWESQPVGCLKAHCPFLHQNPRPSIESVEKSNISAEKSTNGSESSERKVTAVDSLVVNFEEESDTESMPAYSPLKSNRIVKVKTLEEIRLEQIQAESASYYSVTAHDLDSPKMPPIPWERVLKFNKTHPDDALRIKRLSEEEQSGLGKRQKIVHYKNNGDFQVTLNKPLSEDYASHQTETDIENIKIKTLAEIRAERNTRKGNTSEDNWRKKTIIQEDTEVSSTSQDENEQKNTFDNDSKTQITTERKRKIKLRRKLPLGEENVVSSNVRDENVTSQQNVLISECEEPENLKCVPLKSDVEKLEEDVLLLDDDEEDYEDVTLKAEEELLNEINSFIDN